MCLFTTNAGEVLVIFLVEMSPVFFSFFFFFFFGALLNGFKVGGTVKAQKRDVEIGSALITSSSFYHQNH